MRYVDHGNPVTKLASIQALEHGNAEGVHQGVMKGLATMEITADKLQHADSSFPTLVCANFDGASVMMGSKSGVATRIQQSFPWVIPIHCVTHKLELGILDGVKAVKYLSEFEAIVKTIYLFYHYSPKRRRELTEIATVLEEDLLQYGAVKNVRWVTSKSRALKVLSRNLPSTYVHVEHASANNRNADEVGKAQKIKKTIQTVRFVKYLHLMQDFLELVVATSRSFQQIALLIVDVPNHIDQLIMKLKHLKSFPGKHMGEFYEKLHKDATFGDTGFKVNTAPSGKLPTSADYTTDKDVAELVDATIKYLTSMEPPLSYFNAMNVPMWPYDSEELVDYGVGDISGLVNHYRILFTDKEVYNIPLECIIMLLIID